MAGLSKKQPVNLVKVTRPTASKILLRQRLLDRLGSCNNSPVLWVSGPAGSGKTTLISSHIEFQQLPCLWYRIDFKDDDLSPFYNNLILAAKKTNPQIGKMPTLSQDCHFNTQEFSHNFFAALFDKLDSRTVIVLDNYQEIPEEAMIHDFLLEAFNLLPEGMRIIIISRKEPLAKYSRNRINRMMDYLGWQHLRFTPFEFKEVIRLWGFDDVPEKTNFHIHQKLNGWITGLLFMLDGTKRYNTSIQHVGIGAYEDIFSYFSEEVFNYMDDDLKHFLLTTSVLPHITVRLAHELSGNQQTAKTLCCLDRNNLFIERLSEVDAETFQYNPLFSEYLQNKLHETYKPVEVYEIKRRAADLLLAEEKVEEAADMLLKAQDWDGLLDFIKQYAQTFIAQGETNLLLNLINRIPVEKNFNNPWITYWSGICQQQSDPSAAQKNFADAFYISCDQQNFSCSFAAWISLVRSIIAECNSYNRLDPLIEWLDLNYRNEHRNLCCETRGAISTCMAEALMIRKPYSPDLIKWIDYATADASSMLNLDQSMQSYNVATNYYMWQGSQSNAFVLLDKTRKLSLSPKVSSLSVLKAKYLEAKMHAWYQADAKKSLETVDIALDIARSTNNRVLDNKLYALAAFGALLDRDYNKAIDYLRKIESEIDVSRHHSYFWYYYLSAWINLLRGNILQGCQFAQNASDAAKKTGHILHKAMATFLTTHLLFEKGDFKKASDKLNSFGRIMKPLNSLILDYMFYITKAQFSFDLGKEKVGIKYLTKAMKLGRQESYSKLACWWNPKVMSRLCMKALEKGIETTYVKEMIIRQNLVPISSPIEIEQWPWPIKIYTLGRFEIVKNGASLRSNGKAQQKPLVMLKALIALGGRNISEFQLSEALWPDADGDMQHQSLATTLHRLRRLLGEKDMIDYQNGSLSLNSRYIWVDAWAFERLLSQAETESQKNEEKSPFFAARYAERAINFYNGSFLPQSNLDYWSIHLRERLKSRFLRGVIFLGRNLEKINEREKAALHYLKALEIDPLVEEFYQRLMICYHRLGRNAEAISVFMKCQNNLRRLLNVEPSLQTKAIHNNLISKPLADLDSSSPIKKEKISHL
jgi:ATP/maltotriose-dependent transcriptional regulator MalT/DNA-binding SARP family transcriptional activator